MTDPRIDNLARIIAELLVAVVDLAKDGAAVEPQPAEEPRAKGKPRGRPPRSTAQSADSGPASSDSATAARTASQEKADSSLNESSKPSADGEADEQPATRLEVHNLTLDLHKVKGREVTVKVLESFGSIKADGRPSVTALKDDQLDDYRAAVREALEA